MTSHPYEHLHPTHGPNGQVVEACGITVEQHYNRIHYNCPSPPSSEVYEWRGDDDDGFWEFVRERTEDEMAELNQKHREAVELWRQRGGVFMELIGRTTTLKVEFQGGGGGIALLDADDTWRWIEVTG